MIMMNCKVFCSAPLAFTLMAHSTNTNVLCNVKTYLNTCEVSFVSLIIDTLQNPELSLVGKDHQCS